MAGKNILHELIKFDNQILHHFPVDTISENYVRSVKAIQSRVKPTPVNNPRLIAWSESAAKFIGLDNKNLDKNDDMLQVLAGNQLLPDSEPTSHNYCGFQFGSFAGQLGDGAAILLGEIKVKPKNSNNITDRVLMQLKGAGLTPYSRDADGRKVVRSSIREFLCSEAMHHLNVATTRALAVIKTDDTVIRDMFYTGNPCGENSAIVCRLSESFFRFGTFELFKTSDPRTGRVGPMVGQNDVKRDLLHFIIRNNFKHLCPDCDDDSIVFDQALYLSFFRDVVLKSAELVARWQCVGFCHGVLNTDNMSIVGQTIDYGPFGFMERYNPDLVSNTSDDSGRYRFSRQPRIFEWNLYKFSEALDPIIDKQESDQIVKEEYYKHYFVTYYDIMQRKLGLKIDTKEIEDDDKDLIESLHSVLKDTFVDFTLCFRQLHHLQLPNARDHKESKQELIDHLTQMSSSLDDLKASLMNEMKDPNFMMVLQIMRTNPSILVHCDIDQARVMDTVKRYDELSKKSCSQREQTNRRLWTEWIEKYSNRLGHHYASYESDNEKYSDINEKRISIMKGVNPRFILRNHVAQRAIEAAEADDFSLTRIVLALSERPFDDDVDFLDHNQKLDFQTIEKWRHLFQDNKSSFFQPLPSEASSLRVSCSS